MAAKRIAIIGAGPGGLAAAMLLARRGFQVQVFEKDPVIGGRNAEVVLGDYRFDLGPTFLIMKFLLDELFEENGRSSSSYLDFRLLDPMYRLNFRRVLQEENCRPRSGLPADLHSGDSPSRIRALVHALVLPCFLHLESALGMFCHGCIRAGRERSLHHRAKI
jgi:phytoene dehydrogenase-like protein